LLPGHWLAWAGLLPVLLLRLRLQVLARVALLRMPSSLFRLSVPPLSQVLASSDPGLIRWPQQQLTQHLSHLLARLPVLAVPPPLAREVGFFFLRF